MYYDQDPGDRDVLATVGAILIGGILILSLLLSCIGCSTTKCPECVPEIRTVEVLKPVYSCPDVPPFPELVLPEYPKAPSELTDEAIKNWYAEMSATVRGREDLLLQRIDSLESILKGLQPIPE